MADNHQADYREVVAQAIFAFQMIEEALKIRIGLSQEAIASSLKEPLIFKVDKKKITEAPLGKLIQMYSVHSQNTELIKWLQSAVRWRNFLAHEAFTREFLSSPDDTFDEQKTTKDLLLVIKGAHESIEVLRREIKALREMTLNAKKTDNC